MNDQYLHMHCFLCRKATPISKQWGSVFKYVEESGNWCDCIDDDAGFDVPAKKLLPVMTNDQECVCNAKE